MDVIYDLKCNQENFETKELIELRRSGVCELVYSTEVLDEYNKFILMDKNYLFLNFPNNNIDLNKKFITITQKGHINQIYDMNV
jgi:predicted nucleic acid-binding protein